MAARAALRGLAADDAVKTAERGAARRFPEERDVGEAGLAEGGGDLLRGPHLHPPDEVHPPLGGDGIGALDGDRRGSAGLEDDASGLPPALRNAARVGRGVPSEPPRPGGAGLADEPEGRNLGF